MASSIENKVQRGHILMRLLMKWILFLIDEARTPLIISGVNTDASS